MKSPQLKRIPLEDFPNTPQWFGKFLDVINGFIGDVGNGLTSSLTFAENFAGKITTITVQTQSRWTPLTPLNGWSAEVAPNSTPPGWTWNVGASNVQLRGSIASGSVTLNTVLATVPQGMQSAATQRWVVPNSGPLCEVELESGTGNLVL